MKSNKPYSWIVRFGVLLFLLAALSWGGWFWWNDSIAAIDSTDPTPVVFVVSPGDGVKAIASNLAREGLIRSSTGFYLLVKFYGIEKDLQAGDFRLNKTMDAREISLEFTHGTLDVWVTTLEGWRVEEIATKLTKDLDIPEQEFLKYAREGYMFPDTYLVPKDATAAAIAEIFLDTFNQKITREMREDAKKTGLTFEEVITLASIVEREGVTDDDRPTIAGILLNRLEAEWPLQVDASLQYMLGYQPMEKSWWKRNLMEADKKVKSPYNTYLNVGLPAKPISNPGLAAIRAVIYPVKTDYWFYLHDPKGGVHYAETLEGHEANIEKYLQ